MSNPCYFLRLPVAFKNLCKIYPPSVNEVVGNEKFTQYNRLLMSTNEDLEDEWAEAGKNNPQIAASKPPTPFNYLMANCALYPEFEKLAIEAFEFFIHESVTFLYELKLILIGDKNTKTFAEMRFLDENNFFEFQNALRRACGFNEATAPNPNEHPKIKRMKALARYRDKLKQKQGKGLSLSESLVAICCMGIGITPLNIGEISYAAMGALLAKYQNKEKYDIDIRSLLAGADAKKVKPKYWIYDLDQ